MSAQQSIESLFSNVRRFTWTFTDVFNPSSVSCIAFSVEEAREKLLSYLTQIETLQDEYKRVEEQIEQEYKTDSYTAVFPKILQLREEFNQKLPGIDDNTGCYCTRLIQYSPSMEVTVYKSSEKTNINITLGELISSMDPTVKKMNIASFTSWLDG
jgi:hypothetical protein